MGKIAILGQGLIVVAQIKPLGKVERAGAIGYVEVVRAEEVVLRPMPLHAQNIWSPVCVIDEGHIPADVVLLREREELVGQSSGHAEAP